MPKAVSLSETQLLKLATAQQKVQAAHANLQRYQQEAQDIFELICDAKGIGLVDGIEFDPATGVLLVPDAPDLFDKTGVSQATEVTETPAEASRSRRKGGQGKQP